MRIASLLRYPLVVLSLGVLSAACAGSSAPGFKVTDGGSSGGGGGGGGGGDDDGGFVVGPTDEFDAGRISGDAGCAGVKSEGKRSPVYMLIVLDGSGSMQSSSKWTASVQALTQFFQQVQGANDPAFGLGMTVFEDSRTSSFGGNGSIQIPIRVVDSAQATALSTRLTSSSPYGGTPTYTTMQAAYTNVAAFNPQLPLLPNGKKVIVLISDGVPNGGATEQNNVINLARQKANIQPAELAITTFSMGVGPIGGSTSSYDPKFMAQVAVAGGTARPNCDVNNISDATRMCHFQLTPGSNASQLATDFLAAINTIRGLAASCEYAFTVPAGQQLDPNLVSVSFTQNGQSTEVPKSTTNGWRYDNPSNPTKVILEGGWCDQVRNASDGKIEIVLGCAPKVN
jgi:hypothetical protein